jgi:hypothetical protein
MSHAGDEANWKAIQCDVERWGEVQVTGGNHNSPKKEKMVGEGAGKGKMQLGSRGHVKCKMVVYLCIYVQDDGEMEGRQFGSRVRGE